MKIHFCQIYIQVGITFPFGHRFQRFLGEKVTELTEPSPKFIKLLGEDYEITFNVSAKRQLAINEIVGPRVVKKDKDVEYSIFLPYVPIMQQPDPSRSALKHLLEGVYEVFEELEIDTSRLKAEQEEIINKIMSSPEMFVEDD